MESAPSYKYDTIGIDKGRNYKPTPNMTIPPFFLYFVDRKRLNVRELRNMNNQYIIQPDKKNTVYGIMFTFAGIFVFNKLKQLKI
jgi:hypothetical protein